MPINSWSNNALHLPAQNEVTIRGYAADQQGDSKHHDRCHRGNKWISQGGDTAYHEQDTQNEEPPPFLAQMLQLVLNRPGQRACRLRSFNVHRLSLLLML